MQYARTQPRRRVITVKARLPTEHTLSLFASLFSPHLLASTFLFFCISLSFPCSRSPFSPFLSRRIEETTELSLPARVLHRGRTRICRSPAVCYRVSRASMHPRDAFGVIKTLVWPCKERPRYYFWRCTCCVHSQARARARTPTEDVLVSCERFEARGSMCTLTAETVQNTRERFEVIGNPRIFLQINNENCIFHLISRGAPI